MHGFTLDPTIGEFLLSHPDLTTPKTGRYYSVNESNFFRWSKGMQLAVRGFHGEDPAQMQGKNSRYIGSLVADFHRNLIGGGVFIYPADTKQSERQAAVALRVHADGVSCRAAGGKATDGRHRILTWPRRTAPAGTRS